MFKPTRPLLKAKRRLPLPTKHVGPGYYKGNRSGAMGKHTKWGGYEIDWRKVRTYVVPERLGAFKLTPFVTEKMEPTKSGWEDRMTGQKYLDLFKQENPEEFEALQEQQQREDEEQAAEQAAQASAQA